MARLLKDNKNEFQQVVWELKNVECASCAKVIENGLRHDPGVKEVVVNSFTATVRITYLPNLISEEQLRKSLAYLGYPPLQNKQQPSQTSWLDYARFLCAAVVATAQMALMLYQSATNTMLLTSTSYYLLNLVFTGIVIGFSGYPIYSLAYRELTKRTITMNSLVSLSTSAAFIYSVAQYFIPATELYAVSNHGYWEVVSMVIALVLLGKIISTKAKLNVLHELESIASLQIKQALVKRGSEQLTIAIDELVKGDLVLVQPGEVIPVDGTVEAGSSKVSEAIVTGEAEPRSCSTGDTVYYGTTNGTGLLTIAVLRTGERTIAGRIANLIRQVQLTKIPVQQKVDRLASIFVPVVLILAIVAAGVWLAVGPQPAWIYAGIAFFTTMLIACPCALGLATPISLTITISEAARHGLLIRNASVVQALPEINTFVFDKTGTLTSSGARLETVDILHGGKQTLSYLVALAKTSQHPIDQAVVASYSKLKTPEVTKVRAYPGEGITGVISGKQVMLGNNRFITQQLGEPQQKLDSSKTWLVIGKRICAILTPSSGLRTEAKEVIAYLEAKKVEVWMLTGDHQLSAERTAQKIGIKHIKAGVMPHQKLDFIKRLKREGKKVAMIGDGFNDAPALAAADVGIVIGQGCGIAVDAGHLVIVRDNLNKIVSAIEITQACMNNVKQNLFAAFIYNILCLPIAMGILYPFTGLVLTPWLAALAMTLSSLSVTINALTLQKIKTKPELK